MKDLSDGVVSVAARVGAASCLVLASAAGTLAQRGGAMARSAERRVETMKRQGEEYERNKATSDRDGTTETAEERRRVHAVAEQIRHDFEGLQAAYNKIVAAASAGKQLDHGALAHEIGEVKKCAGRLRDNLALPHEKGAEADKAQAAPDAAPAEESLPALLKHIYSFVTNPIFDGPGGLNVEQAARASRDLDMILKLSESVRRHVAPTKGRHD
jgi:hypothetical protein